MHLSTWCHAFLFTVCITNFQLLHCEVNYQSPSLVEPLKSFYDSNSPMIWLRRPTLVNREYQAQEVVLDYCSGYLKFWYKIKPWYLKSVNLLICTLLILFRIASCSEETGLISYLKARRSDHEYLNHLSTFFVFVSEVLRTSRKAWDSQILK